MENESRRLSGTASVVTKQNKKKIIVTFLYAWFTTIESSCLVSESVVKTNEFMNVSVSRYSFIETFLLNSADVNVYARAGDNFILNIDWPLLNVSLADSSPRKAENKLFFNGNIYVLGQSSNNLPFEVIHCSNLSQKGGYSLLFKEVNNRASGNYTFIVTIKKNITAFQRSVIIHVLDKPFVERENVTLGASLTLECLIKQSDVYWYFINKNNKLKTYSGWKLQMPATKISQAGLYECFLVNYTGTRIVYKRILVAILENSTTPLPSLSPEIINSTNTPNIKRNSSFLSPTVKNFTRTSTLPPTENSSSSETLFSLFTIALSIVIIPIVVCRCYRKPCCCSRTKANVSTPRDNTCDSENVELKNPNLSEPTMNEQSKRKSKFSSEQNLAEGTNAADQIFDQPSESASVLPHESDSKVEKRKGSPSENLENSLKPETSATRAPGSQASSSLSNSICLLDKFKYYHDELLEEVKQGRQEAKIYFRQAEICFRGSEQRDQELLDGVSTLIDKKQPQKK